MIHVAVFGYGTVGKGVVEVIDRNNDIVSAASGDKVSVKYILDLLDFPGDPNEAKIVHDVNVIISDPEARAPLISSQRLLSNRERAYVHPIRSSLPSMALSL